MTPVNLPQDKTKEIHRVLSEITGLDKELYEDSPYVALAYRQDQNVVRTLNSYQTPFSQIELSVGESASQELRLWNKFSDYLSFSSNEDRRFKMRYLTFDEVSGRKPGFLLVSMGAKPKEIYWDSAMYDIDDFAAGLIGKGFDLSAMPVWIRTNYPFLTDVEAMKHPGFNDSAIKKIIKEVRTAKNLQLI